MNIDVVSNTIISCTRNLLSWYKPLISWSLVLFYPLYRGSTLIIWEWLLHGNENLKWRTFEIKNTIFKNDFWAYENDFKQLNCHVKIHMTFEYMKITLNMWKCPLNIWTWILNNWKRFLNTWKLLWTREFDLISMNKQYLSKPCMHVTVACSDSPKYTTSRVPWYYRPAHSNCRTVNLYQ